MKYHFVFFYFLALYSCSSNSVQTENSIKSPFNCSCDSSVIIAPLKIEGYTDKTSYFPGDVVNMYVSSPSEQYAIKLIDQKLNPIELINSTKNKGYIQNYNQCAYKDGCNWKLTNSIIIPNNVVSGYMTINLSNKYGEFNIPIIVKSKVNSEILCIASTNTWHAYNHWGGASFYKKKINDSCENTTYSPLLSLMRPLNIIGDLNYKGHLFDAELALVHWLEKQTHDFDVITDRDIDLNPQILQKYKLVFLNTHSEYWTESALNGIDQYLNNKGSLCYLGANAMYWKVNLSDSTIECQKNHQSDSSKGGKWREWDRPEEKTIGVSYNRTGYRTFMPYVVINNDHWLFENTKLKRGDLFGKSLNRKYASGHETDKITKLSPNNIVLLARGLNQEAIDELGKNDADKNGGADMVYFEHPSGGAVFSSGSITSSGSMLIDSSMSRIVENFIRKSLHKHLQ